MFVCPCRMRDGRSNGMGQPFEAEEAKVKLALSMWLLGVWG